jgi:hypothetical protein
MAETFPLPQQQRPCTAPSCLPCALPCPLSQLLAAPHQVLPGGVLLCDRLQVRGCEVYTPRHAQPWAVAAVLLRLACKWADRHVSCSSTQYTLHSLPCCLVHRCTTPELVHAAHLRCHGLLTRNGASAAGTTPFGFSQLMRWGTRWRWQCLHSHQQPSAARGSCADMQGW